MPTNRDNQKSTERRHIEAFLDRAGIKTSVEYGDKPDAVLLIDGRRVGLEHCELEEERLAAHRGNIEALERLLNQELALASLDDDVSLGVSVNAWSAFFRVRRNVEALARQLVALAAKLAPHVSVDEPIELAGRHLVREGVRGPESIIVSRHERPLLKGFRACVTPGFWGPGDSTVLEAVHRKQERLALYRTDRSLAEVWLLLVTGDGWTQATDSIMTQWTEVSSGYARVYLLDLRTTALQRLDQR